MTTSLHKTTHRTVLNNGIVLLVTENPTADIIAGRMFLRAGSSYERRDKAGLAYLLSALLTKGCDGLSSLEIAEEVESTGASLGADAAYDYFLISLKTVTSDFANIFRLAAKILRWPTFPEMEVELEKRLALQDIRSQKEQPFNIAYEQLRQAVYTNHPYGLSALGDETTMSSITRDDLIEFHQTHFRPDNLVISIAGNIRVEDVVSLIEEMYGDWRSPDRLFPILDYPYPQINPQKLVKVQQTQQSIIMLGYLGTSVKDEGYGALKLISSYLGNGLSSRLFVELREKRGLAYDVSALYATRLFPATFIVYIGTAPENTQIAMNGLRAEVDRLSTTKLGEYELQTAKNKILGQYALGKQTNAQIAQIYGWYEILGLSIDFDKQFEEKIAAVTSQDTISVASKYLGEPYVSLVGQEGFVNSTFS
jgi:predicted Zn-dependent peptidase